MLYLSEFDMLSGLFTVEGVANKLEQVQDLYVEDHVWAPQV